MKGVWEFPNNKKEQFGRKANVCAIYDRNPLVF